MTPWNKADYSPMISVKNIEKFFGTLHVLKQVSFRVETAEVVCLIGPSGSGKSTLLRCINFLEQPHGGTIQIDGVKITAHADESTNVNQVQALRAKTGMVFQTFNLFAHRTALENIIEAPVLLRQMKKNTANELGLQLLEKDTYPSRLSGGQQQRVAIARALAMQPKVMLFDEPTSSLDPELIAEVLDVMRQLVNEGMTMIIATHEMDFARRVANKVIFIDQGRIVEYGPPERLFNDPQDPRTAQFLSAI